MARPQLLGCGKFCLGWRPSLLGSLKSFSIKHCLQLFLFVRRPSQQKRWMPSGDPPGGSYLRVLLLRYFCGLSGLLMPFAVAL